MLLKNVLAAVALCALAAAEPALPGQNQYLPPDNTGGGSNGYNYPAPNRPFPPAPPGPAPPGPAPPGPPPFQPGVPPQTVPPVTYPPATPPAVTFPAPPPGTQPPYAPPGPPAYNPPPGAPGHVHIPGMPYEFDYQVNDPYHMANYGHRASSNGDVVTGEYHVNLPDGRTQIVRYTADWATGFHAEVTYEGEASYPPPGTRPAPSGGYPAPGGGPGGGTYIPPPGQTGY